MPPTLLSPVLGCATALMCLLTFYRWHVLSENKKLDSGDSEQIAKVVKRGVTEEMVALGWRYELF
jgi:hypothetical protein